MGPNGEGGGDHNSSVISEIWSLEDGIACSPAGPPPGRPLPWACRSCLNKNTSNRVSGVTGGRGGGRRTDGWTACLHRQEGSPGHLDGQAGLFDERQTDHLASPCVSRNR